MIDLICFDLLCVISSGEAGTAICLAFFFGAGGYQWEAQLDASHVYHLEPGIYYEICIDLDGDLAVKTPDTGCISTS